MTEDEQGGLRARRQARTRAAITTAALDLFGERGYDAVTVTDIAARAEVGRTTFFRYFSDKSDVLFADGDELSATLLGAAADAAAADPEPDGSLAHALRIAHHALRVLVRRIAEYADQLAVYESLIRGHDGLRARSLLKQEQYIADLARALRGHGVPEGTATLAAHLALACYRTASAVAGDRPDRLEPVLTDAFDQILAIGPVHRRA